jgi:hypothetical protein
VAETQIKITADTRSAERDIKNLERALEGLDSVGSAASKALAGIAAAGAAMGYAIAKTLGSVDELAKSSKQLGMTGADLQAFRNSAELAGISSDELTASLRKLQANIGDAMIKGTGPAKDALDRLGISMKDLRGLSADKQFEKIASEIAKIPDPAQRSAVAMDLLGKQGPRLLEAANELERMKQQAQQLGIALTEVDTAAIERAGDAITEIQQIFGGALQKAVADIAPFIEAIAVKIKTAIMNAGGFEAVWQKIKSAIRETINVAAILVTIVAVSKMAAGAMALYRAIVMSRGAMDLFNKTVMKNPLMIAVGAAILLAKVLGVDVVKYMDEYLGLSEAASGITADIKDDLAKAAENQNDLTQGAEEFNQAQQKALQSFDDTLNKLRQQIQYQQDILQYGEEQANINKSIAEEGEKLKKVGLEISDIQRNTIAQLYKEETLTKAITKAREDQRAAIDGIFNRLAPVANKLADLQLKVAQAEYSARQAMGTQLEAQAKEQLDRATWIYREEVAESAIQKSELLKINAEFQRQRAELEAVQSQLIMAGYGTESEMYKALMEEKLRLTQEYGQKIEQAEIARIQRQLQAEKGAIAQALSTKDQEVLQRAGAEEKQKQIAADRIAFEKKSDLEKTQFALTNMQSVFAALGTQNKKAFEASKALAIASALVNTYQGATKALATYPFPFGLIAAAAAVAAGMAQVAAIRSQQYQGRALGGPVLGGQSYIVGESGPELFTPNTTGSITRNGDLGGGGTTNVNFTIVANDTEGFDQLLTSRQGVIKQIISDAMLERGSRSIV